MKQIGIFLAALFIFSQAAAQINQPKEMHTFQKFGEYTVHYTLFNSKQIPPDVAKIYHLTRSNDIAYINISLTKTEQGITSLGMPAMVKAKAINLMQQTKAIQFMEIKEPDATYYLASIRHTNEEDFRFEVSVIPEGETKPLQVMFNRRLYTEN